MSELSLTQRERRLIRDLAALVADRASTEAALAERRRIELAAADRDLRDAVARATAEGERALKEADADHRAASEVVRADHDRELSSAKAAMAAELGAFAEQTSAIESAARKQLDDAVWLSETVAESGRTRAQQEHAAAEKAVSGRRDDLAGLAAGAAALLNRPLPDPPAAEAAPETPGTEFAGAPMEPVEALQAQLDGAVEHARGLLDRLTRLCRPRFLSVWWVLIVLIGSAAAGAVPAVMRTGVVESRDTAYGALIGLAAASMLLIGAWLVVRRRIPRAARELSAAIAAGRAAASSASAAAAARRDRLLTEVRDRREREIEQAQRRCAEVQAKVAERRERKEPQQRAAHRERIGDIESRKRAAAASADGLRSARRAEAEKARDEGLAGARSRHEAALADITRRHGTDHATLARRWLDGLSRGLAEAAEVAETTRRLCPPWGSPAWSPWEPRGSPPAAVPLGSIRVDLASMAGGLSADPALAAPGPTAFDLPVLADLLDKGSVLLQCGPEGRAQALQTVSNLMLRLLAIFPPGKARFTIIDPVGLGQNFAGFMHLADYEEALVADKIWTEARHIEQKLTDLTEHMENVIQKFLRNEFGTIQEYNDRAGEVAEPFRFLVVADFPANFTEAAAKRLASIVTSGRRCGVFTLVIADTRQKLPAWAPLSALERAGLNLVWRDGRFAGQDEDFGRWPLTLDAPPPEAEMTRLLHEIGRAAKDSGRVRVPFEAVAPPAGERWTQDASEAVSLPLGRAGATKLQHLTLGRGTAQHALIAGRTGSGKSTLLHVMITNLALWYSPDEVELYLVDFKKGVEFKTYATHGLPHARVIAIESEREFGLSVLRRLDAELTRRGALFRDAGVQDLAGYRRSPLGGAMPRTLLLVDEFQEFFVEDDRLAQEASLLLDRLVRQGRAFGLHVVLGSQTLGGAYSIARSTIGQMAVRIALQCGESDSYLIMSEDNPAPRLLSRPGEAIYNDASGLVEGNSLFQIVWLPEDKREACLRDARALLAETHRRSPPPPIVFEGNAPGDVARNHLLARLLADPPAPRPAPALPLAAWLGDAVSIKDPASVAFRAQGGSNLLIVGQQEDTAGSMIAAVLVGLAASQRARGTGAPRFTVLDPGGDASDPGPLRDLDASGVISRVGPRDVGPALAELAAELDRRMAAPASASHPPAWLVIPGLHRLRDLRRSDDFFSRDEGPPGPDRVFQRLVRDGPSVGLHVIAWCDSANNLDRFVDRALLREFQARVLLQMSAADSTHLIDTPAAASLGRNRALVYSDETATIEKFRPYAAPSADWLRAAASVLAAEPAARPRPA